MGVVMSRKNPKVGDEGIWCDETGYGWHIVVHINRNPKRCQECGGVINKGDLYAAGNFQTWVHTRHVQAWRERDRTPQP